MITNYLKVALRSLLRQKALTVINVLGLSVGLACSFVIALYAVNEFSFDRFHVNGDRIFRVYRWSEPREDNDGGADPSLPMPLGPAIKEGLTDVEEFVRFSGGPRVREEDGWIVRTKNVITCAGITFADPEVLSVFSFPLKHGDPRTALKDLHSIVVSELEAERLFGETNPLGKQLEVKVGNEFESFTVTAVAQNLPSNSSLSFDVLANFEFLATTPSGKSSANNWHRSSFQTYVLLREGSNLAGEPDRLLNFRRKYYPNEESELRKAGRWTGTGAPVTYGLQPLRAMHTDTRMWGGFIPSIDPRAIWLLLGIAAGVLLIACINFTTLAIGRSAGRAKEIGIRKVVGGGRTQLAMQFVLEAMVLSVLSALLGFVLAELVLPFFNDISGRRLEFSLTLYPELSALFVVLTLFAGTLSGSYPALVLSGFRPVEILKGKMRVGGSNLFTRFLLTLQFALSAGLIVSTIVILDQVRFLRTKHPGFDKEHVVIINAEGTDAQRIYSLLRTTLSSRPEIAGVAASDMGLGAGQGWSGMGWNYMGKQKDNYEYFIDESYLSVMGMRLLAGRNFDMRVASDTLNSVIVNEAFVKDFEWTVGGAIGQRLTGYTDNPERTPTIIGVVQDFHFRPFTEVVKPQLFHHFPGNQAGKIFIRIKPGDTGAALHAIQNVWTTVVNDAPFTYSFVDENLDAFYKNEARWSPIVGWAGGISIFLGCLGLLGLSALASVNRTKEIGVRKVLGATVSNLTALLAREFIKTVVLANLIAWPIAYFAMNRWLQDFAYRVEIGWWVFALAGGLALLIAMLTVSFQAIKAALANPVDALRYE
jgi:putative ABC transport system permease protein